MYSDLIREIFVLKKGEILKKTPFEGIQTFIMKVTKELAITIVSLLEGLKCAKLSFLCWPTTYTLGLLYLSFKELKILLLLPVLL